jgi:hydroxypyruvate reductase
MTQRTETGLRTDALAIFDAAVAAAEPRSCVRRVLSVVDGTLRVGDDTWSLDRFQRVIVLGAGKASTQMAQEVEAVLGERVTAGLITTKDGHTADLERIEAVEAGHPYPDARGMAGAERIAAMGRDADGATLALCLISGGGSALLPLPVEDLDLEDKLAATEVMQRSGMDIGEMNAVRKHLSAIKGGRLARLLEPATVRSFLLSDVIGDPLDVIASGPTAPDESTYGEALAIINRFGAREAMPRQVIRTLEEGARGEREETPKVGDPAFARCKNQVVGSNALALAGAQEEAEARGYRTLVLTSQARGEAREVAKVAAAIAGEMRTSGRPLSPPACVILGGETTVTVRGPGRGGRNQELALAAALEIGGMPGVLILSGGTDGTDGPTDAAGGFAVGTSAARAASAGVDLRAALAANDAYTALEALGNLVMTGPTGTNVMDVIVILVG